MHCGTEGGYRYGQTNGDIPRDPVTFPTIANYRTGLLINNSSREVLRRF